METDEPGEGLEFRWESESQGCWVVRRMLRGPLQRSVSGGGLEPARHEGGEEFLQVLRAVSVGWQVDDRSPQR